MTVDFFWDDFKSFAQRALELSAQLPADRQELLRRAAVDIAHFATEKIPANLLFVCTHNSRRSQFSQVWAAVAVSHYNVRQLQCFSCGTEATACNPRTVESLRRVGVEVKETGGTPDNPLYRCTFTKTPLEDFSTGASALQPPPAIGSLSVELFSKAFGHASLPTDNLAAMMCCDDADTKCPNVLGAKTRVALHYRDPKHADGTPTEAATYDERSLQIAAEMLYLVRQFKEACK